MTINFYRLPVSININRLIILNIIDWFPIIVFLWIGFVGTRGKRKHEHCRLVSISNSGLAGFHWEDRSQKRLSRNAVLLEYWRSSYRLRSIGFVPVCYTCCIEWLFHGSFLFYFCLCTLLVRIWVGCHPCKTKGSVV